MSRSLSKPYLATNPRSVDGAKQRGWHIIKPNPNYVEKSTWTGLNIWCERMSCGYWISSFHRREFAFESTADAVVFMLKWQ